MPIQSLEWTALKQSIEAYAKTVLGRHHITSLEGLNSPEDATHSMHEIRVAKAWIESHPSPEFGAFFDIQPMLRDIKIERVISISEQLKIFHFLKGVDRLQVRFKNAPHELDITPLKPYVDPLDSLKSLRDLLHQTYEPDRVLDSASSDLKSIRQSLSKTEKQLNDKLRTLVEKHKDSLSEGFFTQRHGRYVLPIKLTVKNRFKGAVVDYSASGETVYMEPYDIGELSAEKRRLLGLEETEVERILAATSAVLHEHYATLDHNQAQVGGLDAIFAKAQWALMHDASPVTFSSSLHLIEARHPFIDPKTVVANTITLKTPQTTLIISGSNTGGKTVVLKTVGICALLSKSGLLVPAAKGSEMPFYRQIYADIGDEQSIEQSLSTFSSHLTHIIEMVKKASSEDLILLDEVGGGTDPMAGAALARAIIDYFRALKTHLLVTTHYPELKAYAYDHDDVVNASVAFDKNTLKPTYQLFLDTPGESHAFLIAERLGLDAAIIQQANQYHENEKSPISDLMQTLESKKIELEKDRLTLKAKQKALDIEYQAFIEEKEKHILEKRTYKDQLKRKHQKDLERLQTQMDEAIEELKTKSNLKMHDIQTAKASLNEGTHSVGNANSDAIEVGDRVEVLKFNRPGQVMEIKNDQVKVQMGNLDLNLKPTELRLIKKDTLAKVPDAKVIAPKRKPVSSECDLRGLRAADAEEALMKYIDDCSVSGVPFARIIHGFGTLAIRNLVKEKVATHPLIASSRDGQANEGGNGVTVVYFETH